MPTNIRNVQIFGERNTGSNYLEHLIRRNLRNVNITWQYGWKHWQYSKEVETAGDCLFLVIHRSPFTWLRSMHHRPHHVAKHLRGLPFAEFVSSEWWSIIDEDAQRYPDDPIYGQEIMEDRRPDTGQRYSSLLQLRSIKAQYWMQLKDKVRHFANVTYEELQLRPHETMRSFAQRFDLELHDSFSEVQESYGVVGTKHTPTKHAPLRRSDVDLIVKGLDVDVERASGYDVECLARRQRIKAQFRALKWFGDFSSRQFEACKSLLFRGSRKILRLTASRQR